MCRLIDGKYPNYEAVIPKENPNKLMMTVLNFEFSASCSDIFEKKQHTKLV
jgi:DNA polymerase-3 subunit beta